MAQTWTLQLNQSHGSLLVRTAVEGRAARMGHRLTLDIASWTAEVTLTNSQPTSSVLSVDLTTMEVLDAEGGVTPLTAVDRSVIKRNALKSMKVGDHPMAVFDCPAIDTGTTIADSSGTVALAGDLTIAGANRPLSVDARLELVDDDWHVQVSCEVRQTDFGIKPYSLMVGALRVADTVTVEFHGRIPVAQLTRG